MLQRQCLLILSSMVFSGFALAQVNDPAMRCGDAYVGQECEVEDKTGMCKATICCDRDSQGQIERSSCHDCARCVTSKRNKLSFGSKAFPILRQNEHLKKLKLPFASGKKQANASRREKGEGVGRIVGLKTVRRQTIPMKSRVPSVDIPDVLNLIVCLMLGALGTFGAFVALFRREKGLSAASSDRIRD